MTGSLPATIGYRLGITTVVFLALAPPLRAQDARTYLQDGVRVWEQEVDAARAIPLLMRGLDPAGPRDSLWNLGAQYLVDLLWEADSSLARVWHRWVVEAHPDIALNELFVRSAVVDLIEAERRSVAGEPEGVVQTSWTWPTGALAGLASFQVRAAPGVRVSVVGQAALVPGTRLELTPGVYQIRAEAAGFTPAVISRAALPGVRTVVGFELRPIPVVAQRDTVPTDTVEARVPPDLQAARDSLPRMPAPRLEQGKKKGFPWAIALLGAAGAGAAAFFLLKPKGGQVVETGTVPITVTIP